MTDLFNKLLGGLRPSYKKIDGKSEFEEAVRIDSEEAAAQTFVELQETIGKVPPHDVDGFVSVVLRKPNAEGISDCYIQTTGSGAARRAMLEALHEQFQHYDGEDLP